MRRTRCAIYTRKSSEEGLDQDFNSLDAQREACEAYVASQRHEGWVLLKDLYDDGGISGGHLDRPGLKALMQKRKSCQNASRKPAWPYLNLRLITSQITLLGKHIGSLHYFHTTAVFGLLCADMLGVGRGIPVFEYDLGKHGATVTGLRPGLVAQNREEQRPPLRIF